MDGLLSNDDAALVFRRAAELEATGGSADSVAMLDERTLLDVGREAGLSEAALRRALVELRNGLLRPDAAPGLVGPRVVTARRMIRAEPAVIADRLVETLRGDLFERVRDIDTLLVFARRGDVGAQLARGLKNPRLRAARSIEVSTVPSDGFADVTLTADLGPTRGAAAVGMSIGAFEATAGSAAGVGLGLAINPAFLLIAAPAIAIGGGISIGVRYGYRATVRRTQLALEGLLDGL